jgi:hypothetical protein
MHEEERTPYYQATVSCVRIWSPTIRPNGLLGFASRALIGGAQLYMVGGPPSHCAINRGGGRPAWDTRLTSAVTPHRHPDPWRAQPVTGSRHRLHRPSPPASRWHQRTRRPPLLRPLLSPMVCDPILYLSLFTPLCLCSSCIMSCVYTVNHCFGYSPWRKCTRSNEPANYENHHWYRSHGYEWRTLDRAKKKKFRNQTQTLEKKKMNMNGSCPDLHTEPAR